MAESEATAAAPDDDLKRRFKEALDKKNAANAASTEDGKGGDSKVHGAHGSEAHQKTFRRKSGG